jgi:hypothetical protein
LDEVVALDLTGSSCDGCGLAELAEIKNLSRLDLNETRVTDAGLRRLAAHKNLAGLYLRDTRNVSDAGVAELHKALPKCMIVR